MTRTIFAALAATILSTGTISAAHATDSLRLLATVSQAQAEAANEEASATAEQKAKLRSNIQKRLDDTANAIVQNLRG